MTISHSAQKFIIVFGVAGLLFYLIRMGGTRKPKALAEDAQQQKKDASQVMKAYQAALKANETPARLEELNRLTEKEFGMRVYKKSDGKYAVKDVQGNDVKLQ